MDKVLKNIGNFAAITGIVICLIAGLIRLSGNSYFFGYEAITLFIGGIAFMVLGCLAKLSILERSREMMR